MLQDGALRGGDPFSSLNGPARGFTSSNGDPFKDSDFFNRATAAAASSTSDPFGAKDPFASGTSAKVDFSVSFLL